MEIVRKTFFIAVVLENEFSLEKLTGTNIINIINKVFN